MVAQAESLQFDPRKRLVRLAEGNGSAPEAFKESDTEALGVARFRGALTSPAAVARQAARGEAIEGFQVLARAGEFLDSEPMEGDLLLRTIEGGGGHAAVVASRGLFEADEAVARGMQPDTFRSGGYAHLVETTPWMRPERERYSRRMTDGAGRLLEDLLLLRLIMPPSPTPPVVKVETPPTPRAEEPLVVATGADLGSGVVNTESNKEDELSCNHIDAAQLSWPGATANALNLMRNVYMRQVAAACQIRNFIADVPAADLASIETGVTARREAAEHCQRLLADARSALAADTSITSVGGIGVISGYRSATHQLTNWNRNFPRYYEETKTDRTGLDGGEFGTAAATLLTRYISRRLAAPGFSLHNDGRAIDFSTTDNGRRLGADSNTASRSGWRRSWFFRWLTANANGYGFFQNTSIDEPWHWEYRGTAAPTQSEDSQEFALPVSDTMEPTDLADESFGGRQAIASETTIPASRLELSNTPLLTAHRGTQPDLILRWNDMTDQSTLDIVVHLHGYSSNRANMQLRNKEAYSGLDFADPSGTGGVGRTSPTLGIVPRGAYSGDEPGANPERYSFPALFRNAALRDLISYSQAQFQNATSATMSVGRLILTAHSGGGAALMRILTHNTPLEIQVFDALYSDASALISWVNGRIAAEIQAWTTGKTRADGGLCIIYRKRGTETQSLVVRRAINRAIAGAPSDAQPVLRAAYRVLSTNVAHGEIPRKFGWRLLSDISADLTDATHVPSAAEVSASPLREDTSESIGDGSPFVAQAVESCWSQVQSLRRTRAAADNPSLLSRTRIAAESRVTVDQNPYSGLSKGHLEAVIRAGFSAYQPPEVLLALWAKEGSLRMTTTATAVPNASTAANARALFRSNAYYVDLGSDYFVLTTYDPVRQDNVWANTDEAAPRHEARFRSQVQGLVGSNLLSEDISGAVNAALAVSSGAPFTVLPSVKFYSLSLLLMDALFTRMQRNAFPQVSSLSTLLNYMQWNTRNFAAFLTSAEQHRQEPAYRSTSGNQATLEQWALHTVPKATEWNQARVNAIRFMHYVDSYRPIFANAMNLIKPGIEDLTLARNVA